MSRPHLAAGAAIFAVIASALIASPATAQSVSPDDGLDPDEQIPTFAEVPFAHAVSLESALSITEVDGIQVDGYHLVSDTLVGDYWTSGGLTVDQFLTEVQNVTGTAPEVSAAFVDGQALEQLNSAQRGVSSDRVIGRDLPVFDAPDADPEKVALVGASRAADERVEPEAESSSSTAAYERTWVPNDATAQVQSFSSTNLAIVGKYSWYGLNPFASPIVMADHWGMEFQFDFYTQMRPNLYNNPLPWGYGKRPHCGSTSTLYKDWAAASTRPYNWFGWVIDGQNMVAAPGSMGLYGDFNDLSDPCDVSTIAVGMAAPWNMPSTLGGTNELDLRLYPLRGEDSSSRLGAIVQPVSRSFCESNPTMYLMDCMGVTPGDYPGPGQSGNRMVLNQANGWHAPNLCWYSGNFGNDLAQWWGCGTGS